MMSQKYPKRSLSQKARVPIFAALICLFTTAAHADVYFEQKVHATKAGTGTASGRKTSDYVRKTYIFRDVLAFQIERNGFLEKEFGFDFAKNRYYEADPATDYFKWFDLNLLKTASADLRKPEPISGRQRNMAREFSEILTEGSKDYPIKIRKALFGHKKIAGLDTTLYKLSAGPGSAVLNPFGWYRRADIWAATASPGYEEYQKAAARLREVSDFYKLKVNAIADTVTLMARLPGFPMRVDSIAKRRFGVATARETSFETTSNINTKPIDRTKLLYFKNNSRFSWHAVFSKGTDLGRDVSMKHGEDLDLSKTLGWLLIPFLFLVSAGFRFLSSAANENDLSVKKRLIIRIYALFLVLFLIQAFHYLSGVQYLVSPLFELGIIFLLGSALIFWETSLYLKEIAGRMQEEHFMFCPHCKAPIQKFYLVCPKCNRSLKADE